MAAGALGAAGRAVAGAAGSAFLHAQLNPWARGFGYNANRSQPNLIPEVGALLAALTAQTIDRDYIRTGLRMHGVYGPLSIIPPAEQLPNQMEGNGRIWDAVYRASLNVPTPGELMVLLNRRTIDQATAERWLRRAGFGEADAMEALLSLRTQYPTPSDLIHFALREAWSPAVVQRFEYDAEFPPEFEHWMGFAGANPDMRTPAQLAALPQPVTAAQLYWRSHWQTVSPTQAYTMFHRLRPGRIDRLGPAFRGMRPFDLSDVEAVLRIADYPRPFRRQLAAIAYRTPRLVDLTKQVDLGLMGRGELIEQHLDLGYTPADAAARADFVIRDRARARTRALRGNARAGLMEAYRLGVIDQGEAARQLYLLVFAGLPPGDALAQLPLRQQIAVALRDPSIQAALADQDRQVRIGYVKEVIRSVRRRYLSGMYSRLQGQTALEGAGLTAARITDLLDLWDAQLAGPRMFVTTARIQRWGRTNVIPASVARVYLQNLGWHEPDLTFLMAETQRGYELEVRREMERNARTLRQQQREQLAQLRELERQRRAVVQRLNAQATAAQLQRWYVADILTQAQFIQGLIARGYASDSIAARLAEADQQRAERAARRSAAGANGSANGTGEEAEA